MTLLAVRALDAFYGDFQALFGIDFELGERETVAVIGANGAGKSTFLRSIAGLLPARPDAIAFDGQSIGGVAPHKIVGRGIAMVPEGRRLFPSLNVEENLRVGAYGGRPGPWTLDRVWQVFPRLAERRRVPGTALSGGEQQMAAIGRALMSNPRVLLCDEVSLGLAPVIVRDLYRAIREIVAEGMSLLVIEQDVGQALQIADRVYCFQEGRVTLTGRPAELTRERVAQAYFGV
jgi:branched-chain amino acid transport system ATP-binding protein